MHAGYLDGRNPHGSGDRLRAVGLSHRASTFGHLHAQRRLEPTKTPTQFCVDNAPHGELLEGSHHLWFELDTTLRGVGHHMLMVVGKVQFMKLFRDRASQLGDDFVLQATSSTMCLIPDRFLGR